MNKIWSSIVIFCFVFSLITNNFSQLINSLFDVPELSIKLLISIGSLIIIYNGIFQIAIDSKLIKRISFVFKPVLKRIYKINNEDTIELLCANFTANLLGLGAASTPIAINILKNTNDERIINKMICMNISCFTIFPLTIITLREKMGGTHNIKIWLFLIVITFMSTIFSFIICSIRNKL